MAALGFLDEVGELPLALLPKAAARRRNGAGAKAEDCGKASADILDATANVVLLSQTMKEQVELIRG